MPHVIEHKIKVENHPSNICPITDQQQQQQQQNKDHQHYHYYESVGNGRNSSSISRSNEKDMPPEKPRRNFHLNKKRSIDGDEETFGTEVFERNLRYSPNEIERQHYSSRTFGDRRSLAPGDGESRSSVRFEDEWAEPVRPVSPIDHTYDSANPFGHPIHRGSSSDELELAKDDEESGEKGIHNLRPSKHLKTTPIRIPRAKMDDAKGKGTYGLRRSITPSSPPPVANTSRRRGRWPHPHPQQQQQPQHSPSSLLGTTTSGSGGSNAAGYGRYSPSVKGGGANRSSSSNWRPWSPAAQQSQPNHNYTSNWPTMKKVIRKSRWVSIHDGRPVSDFVETVHYEPIDDEKVDDSHAIGSRGNGLAAANEQRNGHRQNRRQHAHFVFPKTSTAGELWSSPSSSCCSISSAEEAGQNYNQKHENGRMGSTTIGKQQQQKMNQRMAGRGVHVTQNPMYATVRQ